MHNEENDIWFLNQIFLGHLDVTDKGVVTNLKTGRVIGAMGSGGYPKISLTKEKDINGKWIIAHMQIHRLVWLKFKGLIPSYLQLNHIDTDKNNPSLDNLELTTHSENMQHASENGLMVSYYKGDKNCNAKFTREQVDNLRKLYSLGLISYINVMNDYKVSKPTAIGILKGHSYK